MYFHEKLKKYIHTLQSNDRKTVLSNCLCEKTHTRVRWLAVSGREILWKDAGCLTVWVHEKTDSCRFVGDWVQTEFDVA